MTDLEQSKFEAELRQMKPGKLPEDLMVRLQALDLAGPSHVSENPPRPPVVSNFFQILRWLMPAAAAILITVVIWRGKEVAIETVPNPDSQITASTAPESFEADKVQIGKDLVSSFDAVATLPGGEPVRFRCQQWISKVVVDDEKKGLLVERRQPRVVVVPVGFETY